MANLCSDYRVKGCPASYYLNCAAYAKGKNCWEIHNKACCSKRAGADCRQCEVYKRGQAELASTSREFN